VKLLAADAYRTAHETHRAMVKQAGPDSAPPNFGLDPTVQTFLLFCST